MTQVKNVIRDNYNAMLLNEFLRKEIKDAGFSKFDITKTPTGTRVTLYVTRPGIVIGKKGFGIKALTLKLETDYGLKNPQIAVEEIAKPELSPSVMCNRMGSHIERGTAFRRATMWTLQQIMDGGAMGVQITVSGKLRGDRSAFEKHTAGILPRSGYHAETIVEEDIAHVQTPMGLIGIRIRIAQKDKVVPEFEMKDGSVKDKPIKTEEKPKIVVSTETEEKPKIVVSTETEEKPKIVVSTETEQIKLDEEKIKKIESLEEEEEELK
ncbi:MAG TPA: 30S ribosomal protein S3 [Candidatus Nitrosopelagicus sp.]|nr:30S ribosomal protein S3 [Candidatus Nitrosopelagicus sp.]